MEWSWCVLIFKALRAMDIYVEFYKSAVQGDFFFILLSVTKG